MSKNPKMINQMLWMDLEMTGLNPEQDAIIEVACLVADSNLKIIEEGPELVINQPSERYAQMDDWNQKHHKESGLWDRVVASTLSLREAEDLLLAFVRKHFKPKEANLAGNTIWQDRRFLTKHMPRLEQYLHYRMFDVSTLKLITMQWYPQATFKKQNQHRAMGDIKESLAELAHYRQEILKTP